MSASNGSTGTGKPAAYNVNASSMLSLLSEVSKHSDGHKRGTSARASTSRDTLDDGPKKPKKGSIFDRANRGIEARSAKDRSHMLAREDLSVEARRILESRDKLEKKALLYERLARGETIRGVTSEQLREGLLVDFETKAIEESYKDRRRNYDMSDEDESEDEDDNDESRTVPKRPKDDEDDELVESTDTFGRTRWIRRSELAQSEVAIERQSVMDGGVPLYSTDIKLASASWHPADNVNTYYGDQREFHVYEPTPEEIAARREKLNLDAPLEKHFDAKEEIRNRGAGFIQLSKDKEERKRQMEELAQERENTEAARMNASIEGSAAAKRDKEALERKRLIEEKKQKLLEKRKASEAERDVAKRSKQGA